ncbi:MAG TPA: DUF3455 domain-containing protein [Gaiellaceae bacterium]|nr:DUF3455 domain-containing protein [Gaiellaceae bacterium]
MKGTSRLSQLAVVYAVALGLLAVLAAVAYAKPASPTAPGDPLDPRTYAPESRLFLVVHADGVQKYVCQANGTWLFTDPEATLRRANRAARAIGTHFLNVATGRPVWQAKDGSSVEAARRASAPAAPGSIPPLLLEAVAASAGPDGDRLAATTWVQRLNTSGGIAPAGSCTPGDRAAVPYTADYLFWRAKGA